MKKFISICVLVPFLSAANIKDIQFSGLHHLSNETALSLIELKKGEELDEAKISTAILNLYKQNYFQNIAVEENNGILTFKFKEEPSVAKITIAGIASNDKKHLESLLGLRRGALLDETSLKKAKERIKGHYEAKSYFDTVVEVRQKKLENTESLELEFIVNRSESIIIDKVHLSGSKELSCSDIEPTVTNKEREFMGWMWGRNDGKLKIFELANDNARTSNEYMKEGYLDVQVSSPFLKTYTDTYKADLTYFIKEGEPYKIIDIQIKNPLFSDKENQEILEKLESQVKDIVNIEDVRKDFKTIETKSADLGYAFAQALPDIQKNSEAHEISIVFQVVPNEKVYIRNVIISGDPRTVDRVVRRELFLTEGNLYHRTDLKESISVLRRTSYFESVDIKEERVGETHIDLVVEMKEAITGAASGGTGYSSSGGIPLNASLSDSNIFGLGIKSSVSIDKSDEALSGRISIANPRIADSEYSPSGSFYSNDYEWDEYPE